MPTETGQGVKERDKTVSR